MPDSTIARLDAIIGKATERRAAFLSCVDRIIKPVLLDVQHRAREAGVFPGLEFLSNNFDGIGLALGLAPGRTLFFRAQDVIDADGKPLITEDDVRAAVCDWLEENDA